MVSCWLALALIAFLAISPGPIKKKQISGVVLTGSLINDQTTTEDGSFVGKAELKADL